MKHIAFLLIVLMATSLMAQPVLQPPYERVLIPVFITGSIPGAFGSLWTTQLTVRNESNEAVVVTNLPVALCGACPPAQPRSTFSLPLVVHNPNAGVFLYVGKPGLGKVDFALRVQDVSRQAQTWGTALPVVREKDVHSDSIQVLDIPTDSQFRSALRVYDFDTPADRMVRLRIFALGGNTPLVDTALTLTGPPQDYPTYPDRPGIAMISDLVGAFPQLAGVQRLRIVLDSMTDGLQFWAFVSVTNDETQHVTAITP
jgi:hypothetical protein